MTAKEIALPPTDEVIFIAKNKYRNLPSNVASVRTGRKKRITTLGGSCTVTVTDVCLSDVLISTSWSSFWFFSLCVSLKLSSTHILHKIRGNGLSLSVNGSFSNYDNVQPGTTRSTLDDNKHTHHIKSPGNVSVSSR